MDTSKATELLWNLLSYIDLSSVSEAFAKYLKYLPLFAIGAISSLILTPIVGYIANKYDITYKPGVKRLGKEYDNKEKAMHEGITPSLGGLAITIPVILAILLFFKLDSFSIPLLVSILILVIGATLDDVFNLPAKTQLLYQLLASIVLAFSIIDLTNLSIINLPLDAFTWEFSVLGLQQSFVFPGLSAELDRIFK